MNIVIVSRSTNRHFGSGGMESQLKILAEGLADEHKITVITTSHPTENESVVSKSNIEVIENNVKYIYIGGTTPGLNPLTLWEEIFYRSGLLKRSVQSEGDKNFYEESAKIIKELNHKTSVDYILSQSTGAKGLLKEFKINIPIVVIIHGTISTEIQNRFLSNKTIKNWIRYYLVDLPKWNIEKHTSDAKLFNRAKYIVAVSNDLRTKFLKDYPNQAYKTHVIYNGVDTKLFKPGLTKFYDFTALYVGRMDREKGVDIIIKSIEKTRELGLKIHLKLIGMGKHIYEFKKLVDELHLENQVEFLGQLPNSDLVDFYQKSHVFVFPSRREEGHPMTISESFCSGLPVISTRKGGLTELIVDGETGFYVDDEDYESISYLIEKLASKEGLLSKMSESARKFGELNFGKNAMIQRYSKLLTKSFK